MQVIDHARTHHAGIVSVPCVSGVFPVNSHRHCSFIQLHGVRRKGDWDIQARARLQRDAFGPFEEETKDRGFRLGVKAHVEQGTWKQEEK